MPALRSSLFGAAAAALLLVGGGTAYAQSPGATPAQIIRVPAEPLDIGFPFAGMPGVAALMRHMNRMLNDEREFFVAPAPDRAIEAALRQLPALGPGASGVMVTTVTTGRGTCTQRVIYSANGAPRIWQLRDMTATRPRTNG